MEKEKYTPAELELFEFTEKDVITESNFEEGNV